MQTDTVMPSRRSLRLSDFDYSSAGVYFITICTYERKILFEDPNYKRKITQIWEELPGRFPYINVDAFIIMPNHVHGIIIVMVGAIHELPLQNNRRERRQMLIPKVVGYYKMNTAKNINQLRNTPGIPIWQRNYYERVLRSEEDLNRAREYIINNPLKWELDRENPNRIGNDVNDFWLYAKSSGQVHSTE